VLAQLDDSYVIWDLRDPGDEPAETYPATEQGFERANERFTMLVRLDRRERLPLFAVLRWLVLLGVVVWAGSNTIYITLLDETDLEQGGLIDLVRKSGTISYYVWIGALAVLAALWLERRLQETTTLSLRPARPDER